MTEHDPRCDASEQKVLDDVAQHGWHVSKVLEMSDTPGWAFSIGLYRTFNHPEVIVFGLNADLMHSVINSVGDDVRAGKRFEDGKQYSELIESYDCTFKTVSVVWYYSFLGYANWFYKSTDYSVLQCIWPDKKSVFPWEKGFNPVWLWAQPLLFRDDPVSARTIDLLRSMDVDAGS